MPDSYRCRLSIEVQFHDLDAFGHVNNAIYFRYFEMGRIHYISGLLGRPLRLDDVPIVLVEAACRYRSPALLGDLLSLGLRISHIRRSSFAIEYRLDAIADRSLVPPDGMLGAVDRSLEATIERRLVAEGRTVQAPLDRASGKVLPIDAEWRARVEAFEGRRYDPAAPIPDWGRH